jgi:hypothetical protein
MTAPTISLELAKEVIMKTVKEWGDSATFATLENALESEKLVETEERIDEENGEKFSAVWKLPDSKNDYVIIWMTENKLLIDAFHELERAGKLHLYSTSVTNYVIGGHVLNLPRVKDIRLKKGLKSEHWMPSIVSTRRYSNADDSPVPKAKKKKQY